MDVTYMNGYFSFSTFLKTIISSYNDDNDNKLIIASSIMMMMKYYFYFFLLNLKQTNINIMVVFSFQKEKKCNVMNTFDPIVVVVAE